MYFLKYRPQTIAELDLTNVRQQLGKLLTEKNIPRTFLFAGPKGTGKTSAARILAKAVNCPSPKKGEPCNSCDSCQAITAGTSLAVLEIDAASNRGIDDIRQLKEGIGLAPVGGKYKVYIIDEAHMLTREAFNALLKTLEEPPNHAIFILCTTDPEKILPTVLSRLFRVDFTNGSDKEVERSLSKVIKGEKLKVDKKTLTAIIKVTAGGFRDAQKILESLVLSLGKDLSWDKTKDRLGYWQSQKPESVVAMIFGNQLTEVLKVSQDLAESGTDFADYLNRLLDILSQMILAKAGVGKLEKEIKSLAEKVSFEQITSLARLISQALLEQKNTSLPQLPFQLAVVDFIKKPVADISNFGSGDNQPTEPSHHPKPKVSIARHKSRLIKNISPEKQNKAKLVKRTSSDVSNHSATAEINLAEVEKGWAKLLREVKPMNHSVAAFLCAARPKEVLADTIILEVFYQFHKDKLEEDQNRKIVEDGLAKICGQSLKMKCVLGETRTEDSSKSGGKEDKLYQMAKDIFA